MTEHQHLEVGGKQKVDFVKGTSLSFRAGAFENTGFDHRQIGQGVQAAVKAEFFRRLAQAGWRTWRGA